MELTYHFWMFFVIFDHANACASIRSLVKIHNICMSPDSHMKLDILWKKAILKADHNLSCFTFKTNKGVWKENLKESVRAFSSHFKLKFFNPTGINFLKQVLNKFSRGHCYNLDETDYYFTYYNLQASIMWIKVIENI